VNFTCAVIVIVLEPGFRLDEFWMITRELEPLKL
jgi:hypothetical protein